ncbi:MAG TPA: tol-pal system protein YbgF [Acidobacteria bacterium]|jgi:tol-pal system protein YbgF|nr:tol-pal system protein YbgF [Acidobacteriota bacterium]|tara:strand:- start:948 stop:1856 length:909 start_codon:yes stop_codon:yes gene_type:complete
MKENLPIFNTHRRGVSMARNRFGITLLTLFLFLSFGLQRASAADREHQQLMADLRMLQLQTQELQTTMIALADAINSVNVTVAEQVSISRKTFADTQVMMNTVGDGIRILREKLDDTNVRVSSFSLEIEALRVSIPRIPIPTTDDPLAEQPISPETETVEAPPVGPVTPTAIPGVSPQRLYDMAFADYAAGQWSLAITGFEAYITAFPRSTQADDAQFYIGQTYYNDGKYQDAKEAFDTAIATYLDGDVLPEAYYKRGLSLDRLGNTEEALASFQILIDRYPNSTMTTLAQQAINRLTRPAR